MFYDCTSLAERERGVASAVEAVNRGDLVVMPTDSVYGLGADAFKSWAVTNLLNAKGRGRNVPPPVFVGSRRTMDELTSDLPQSASDMMEAFWPGALTIVVTHAPSLQWDLGDTAGTVAVRMPLHPVALEVLRETGPMAVSAANKAGRAAPATAAEAKEQLGYAVSVYLEAGACPHAMPSTIVDVTVDPPRVLRAGSVTIDQLREVVPSIADVEAEPR